MWWLQWDKGVECDGVLVFCSSALADFSQMNAKYFSLPMDILDGFTLPIIPGSILIILMSLKSFGLVASACKHCKIPHSSILDQKFCLLCMTHITRDITHLFSHLSKYEKKKIFRTVFATEHKKYKVTNLHYLSCNVMEITAEVKQLEEHWKSLIFRVNFHHPNKKLSARNASGKSVGFCSVKQYFFSMEGKEFPPLGRSYIFSQRWNRTSVVITWHTSCSRNNGLEMFRFSKQYLHRQSHDLHNWDVHR